MDESGKLTDASGNLITDVTDACGNLIIDASGNYVLSLREQIVKALLDDDNFVAECKADLEKIMKDGKFDFKDMPHVISLVVAVYTKYDTFDIDEKDIAEVFRLLITGLLMKFSILKENDCEINAMLDSCLTLLVLQVKTKSFWTKYFGWCVCKCCVKSSCSK